MSYRGNSLCPVCEAMFPTPRARTAHMGEAHPGYAMTWAGRVATITAPDGSTRTLSMRDFRTLRAKARDQGAGAAPQGDAGEAQGGPPAGEPGVRAEQSPARPRVAQEPRRPDPATGTVVARATVEDALTREMLADILQTIFEVLSDWDGAGEAGHLSRIEAMSLARLLYEPAVDAVMRRFHGDVSRFKLALALVLILLGKGRVHAQAYDRKRKGLPAPAPAPAEAIPFAGTAAAGGAEADGSGPFVPAPAGIVPFSGNGHAGPAPAPVGQPSDDGAFVPLTPAELARRQSAYMQSAAPPIPLPPQVRESRIEGLYGE